MSTFPDRNFYLCSFSFILSFIIKVKGSEIDVLKWDRLRDTNSLKQDGKRMKDHSSFGLVSDQDRRREREGMERKSIFA